MASINTQFKKGMVPWNKGTKMEKKCLLCTEPFLVSPSSEKTKFCSGKCYHQFPKEKPAYNKGMKCPERSGEKHFAWKGGRSRGYKLGYYSTEYKSWRKAVFERDNFTCQDCGYMGFITAHHIKSFMYFPESRYDINNGRTLCEPCHSKTDNYKGRAKKASQLLKVLTNK